MTDQIDAVVMLLRTRDEGLPGIAARRSHAPSGFVHRTQVRETCPDCFGERAPAAAGPCETCHGKGSVTTWRQRDPYAVETTQPFGLTPDRHERTRERDAQIDRLEQQTREPFASPADELADANTHPEAWEIERRKMYRRFDYALLDRALEELRNRDEAAYHIVHSVYVYGTLSEPTAAVEALVQRGLRVLEAHMVAAIHRAVAAGSSRSPVIRAPSAVKHPAAARAAKRRTA